MKEKKLTYGFNEISLEILKRDYLLENETPYQMFERVANFVANAESNLENKSKYNELFLEEMLQGRLMPASPFLMNANCNNMLHSCFVVGEVEDNLKSICDIDTRCAIITKMGGGLGLNLSKLREKGALIKSTNGRSTGVVSFMKKFNTTLDVVMQGRRRGAGIIILDVYHPEIEDFINLKSNHGEINNFNISVIVDKSFIEAVEENKDIELKSPLGYVVKTINARDLFYEICKNNKLHAEPGILFKDNINANNPLIDSWGEIDSCNACFTGDMKLLTPEGYVKFEDLCDKSFEILNRYGNVSIGKVWCAGRRKVIKVLFDDDTYIKCTPEHIFLLADGRECEAKNLLNKIVISYIASTNCNNIKKVKKIEHCEQEEFVYDFSEPLTSWGIVNGIIVHNCGEISMYANEACCLSSLILPSFVKNKTIDFEQLGKTVKLAIRFLDNSIDVNSYPDKIIEETHKKTRRLGLGYMGLHSMLQLLRVPYDSARGKEIASQIQKFIESTALEASEELVKEGRSPFPAWSDTNSFLNISSTPRRNIAVTSGQPTGATQLLASEICGSSGIEPIFAVVFKRTVRDKIYTIVDPIFQAISITENFYSERLIEKIIENNGSVQGISEIPLEYQELFKTSLEIDWKEHIEMQANIQKYCSNALSKTINMFSSVTNEDIYEAFLLAHKKGCKGCTIYVQGTRDTQPISIERKDNDSNEQKDKILIKKDYVDIEPVMEIASAIRVRVPTGCGSIWLTLVYDKDDGKLREILSITSSKGGCRGQTEAVSRLVSACLRANINPEYIVDLLHSVKCDRANNNNLKNYNIGRSCADGVSKAIKKFLNGDFNEYKNLNFGNNINKEKKDIKNKENKENKENVEDSIEIIKNEKYLCTECKRGYLTKYDGCVQCSECTYVKCN